jgi:hypothetical protein
MMIVLHILALVFFIPALFVTIPLHIIISMMKGRDGVKKESPPVGKVFAFFEGFFHLFVVVLMLAYIHSLIGI